MLFGCSFINVLLELGAAHPAGQASIRYLDNIRMMLRERAEGAALVDVDNFARSWHILMKGSIIAAARVIFRLPGGPKRWAGLSSNDTDRPPTVETRIWGDRTDSFAAHAGTPPPTANLGSNRMIVLGIILILVGYLLPVPYFIATIGWILLVIGLVLLVLGQVGRPVGGRRYWY